MKRFLTGFGALIILIILTLSAGAGHAATQIYSTSDDGFSLAVMDPANTNSSVIGSMGEWAMGLAIDNSNGTFYTIADSGLGQGGIGVPRPTQQIAIVDPETGQATRVGQPFWNWMGVYAAIPALEVGSDGYIYAGGVDGKFYRINKTTGEPSLISSQSVMMIMDYAFDSQGTLWAIAGTQNDLYTVDLATGNATYVKRITGISLIGSGIMGIMFDKNDVLYATNMAGYPEAHLYTIDIGAGIATDLGAISLDWPHGGDIYLPVASCIQPPTGLISWWSGNGNAYDNMGSNDGLLMNGTAFSAGKVRQGFSFDGVDDYVDAGTNEVFNFNNGTGDFTIDAWINPANFSPGASVIVSKGTQSPFSGWSFYVYSDGRLGFGGNGVWELASSPGLITTGNWAHVAVTKNGSAYKLYKNGVEIASMVYGYLQTSSAPLTLGTDFYGLNQEGTFVDLRFNGLIDEVDIFDHALSASEIDAVYNAGSEGKCMNCTDNDGDTYAIEGGACGPVDCNDNNLAVNPGASDANCNGFDENCSGIADEGYVPTDTTCGMGICASTGQNICQNGSIINTCNPGQPQTEGPAGDPTCVDGNDNDCDGLTDALDPICQSVTADFIISSLTAPSGAPDSAIIVKDTTRNNGTGTAGASTTGFYWSTNSTYDAGDVYLGSRTVPLLAAGASSAGSTSITIPSNTCTGAYYIIARADANNAVPETNETNNNRSVSILIRPDLLVSSIAIPASAGAGQNISVSDTTKNNGGCAAGASATGFYWSTNSAYDAGDVYLGQRDVPALLSGASNSGSTAVTVPSGITSGTYYIIARADAGNVIAETNETNNNTYKSIIVN